MARYWKIAFWWVVAICMGLFAAVCLSGFFLGAVETCSGLSVDARRSARSARRTGRR